VISVVKESSSGNKGVDRGSFEGLPIPSHLVEQYNASGISTLYPPQVTCIKKGLFEGKNLVISIPTASGKTLIAEMAMHHQIAAGGKCLYVVPLKALASEKYDDFSGKGVRVGISTGDFDRSDEKLGRSDIIVATSEKVDSLLRNRTGWINSISLLVIDEIHLIGDEGRGATLEMVITTMRNRNPDIQVIGLSATIGNPKELAGWLSAELVESEWRPVNLREGVYFRGAIRFSDGERKIQSDKKDSDTNLCLDTIAEGGQALVFVSSRRNAEGAAKRIGAALRLDEPELHDIARQILESDESEVAKTLAACIRSGSAFHHAGLSRDVRKLVEGGFRKGAIRVIASTPTLAAGLNLPARRVIINSVHRFVAGEGQVPIPVREYRQMAGRAGRPGLDPYGEAILIGKSQTAVDELFEGFILAKAEEIESQCAKRSTLLSRILALIASREATDHDAISRFFQGSFYAVQHANLSHLNRICTKVIKDLDGMGMAIDLGGRLEATEFGDLTSKLYLDPRSAVMIADALRERDSVTPFGLLHLLSATPDMFRLYLRSTDGELIETVMEEREEEFLIGRQEDLLPWLGYEEIVTAIKTALVLENWINEVPVEMIAERFSIGPGDIHGLVEGIGWLIHATREICRREIPILHTEMSDLEIRLKHGVKEELLPLIRLRGIGRVRARSLFNSGYDSPAALAEAGVGKIARIIGQKTAESILEQIRRGGRKGEDDEKKISFHDTIREKKTGQREIMEFWESGEE
jgi:helicase